MAFQMQCNRRSFRIMEDDEDAEAITKYVLKHQKNLNGCLLFTLLPSLLLSREGGDREPPSQWVALAGA